MRNNLLKPLRFMIKTKKCYILLLLSICIIEATFGKNTPNNIILKLSSGAKKEYKYHTDCKVGDEAQFNSTSSFNITSSKNGNFLIKEVIEEMNFFDRYGKQTFSLDAQFSRRNKRFYFQHLLNTTKLEKEIDENGDVIKGYDVNNIFENTKGDLSRIWQMLQRNDPFFYLDRELIKGKSFKHERQFAGLDIDVKFNLSMVYSVFDINDKQTILSSKAEAEIPIDNDNNKIKLEHEGVFIIENSTGLLLYCAEITDVKDMKIIYSVTRDDYKALSIKEYFLIKENRERQKRDNSQESFANDATDISLWGDISQHPKTKQEAQKLIRNIKPQIELKEKSHNNPQRLVMSSEEKNLRALFKLNNVNCTYCNKEIATVNNSYAESLFNINPYDEYTVIPNVFIGDDCFVEKLTVDLSTLAYYGVQKHILTKDNVGCYISFKSVTNNDEFCLISWNENTITLSNCSFLAYGADGKQLKKAIVKRVWPQCQSVAKLLGMQEANVTDEQIWFYSSLTRGHHQSNFIQLTFKEPVTKVIVSMAEDYISENQILEVSNEIKLKEKLEDIAVNVLERETAERKEQSNLLIEKKKQESELKKQYEEQLLLITKAEKNQSTKANKSETQKSKERKQSTTTSTTVETSFEDNEKEIVVKTNTGTVVISNGVVKTYNGPTYTIADIMPVFPGGKEALNKFIKNNLQYPTEAKANKICGKVYVKFIIEKDGQITNVKIVKSIDKSLDEEAVRLIKSFPDWKPGFLEGRIVRMNYMLPINFTL